MVSVIVKKIKQFREQTKRYPHTDQTTSFDFGKTSAVTI